MPFLDPLPAGYHARYGLRADSFDPEDLKAQVFRLSFYAVNLKRGLSVSALARLLQKQVSLDNNKKKFEPLQFAAVVRRRLSLAQWLFVSIVAIPALVAALYFGAIAQNRYVSEAAFLVRGPSSQSAGGLAVLLRSFGLSRADEETFVVQDFMQSRDAARRLNERIPFRQVFSRPGTDWFSRYPAFWRRDTFEAMYNYYLTRVKVVYGTSTGITQLRVTAFRAEDARDLTVNLLQLSEELVNRMNERAQRDALEHAQSELSRAEEKVVASQAAITSFRNRELLVDPSNNSAKTLEVFGTLATELAHTKTQLQETMTSSPSSPAIQGLRGRIAALQDQMTAEQAKMAGGDSSLASKMSGYERLVLNREFADRELTLASGAFELARQEARRQHIYIETISEPNLPDESTEPRRWRGFFTVIIFATAVFAMVWFFMVGAKEQLHG